jgi:hypothetical protein
MTEPSLILRFGDVQLAAYGYFAAGIVAVVVLIVLRWWRADGRR